MKTKNLNTLRFAALAIVSAITLLACGGSGVIPGTGVASSAGGTRALSAEFSSRKAVAYSPFRSNSYYCSDDQAGFGLANSRRIQADSSV
jgi:hypothetical protein